MAFLDQFEDVQKTAIAKKKQPRVKRWVGVRGTGTRRDYVCYLCGDIIDSESAKYPPTKHAAEAISQHNCTGE